MRRDATQVRVMLNLVIRHLANASNAVSEGIKVGRISSPIYRLSIRELRR